MIYDIPAYFYTTASKHYNYVHVVTTRNRVFNNKNFRPVVMVYFSSCESADYGYAQCFHIS